MKYRVTFTQCYDYDIEAEDEDEAVSTAEREFRTDMLMPVARTVYDYVDVEEQEDSEDE